MAASRMSAATVKVRPELFRISRPCSTLVPSSRTMMGTLTSTVFTASTTPLALAALLFFQKAAQRERVTAKLAREIATFLQQLRANPALRFERR